MKKLLLVANSSKEHVRKFHIPFITYMKQNGWQVDVACRMDEQISECDNSYDLPYDRNPFKGGLYKSILCLRDILKQNEYDVIHCNTITGSLVARIAAIPFRKNGLKVFYINHGLHFFHGASLSRWLFGYPMEKLCARYTDVFIAINSEDMEMAKKHLHECGSFERIHGIGVNLSRFRKCTMNKEEIKHYRRYLGLSEDDFVMTYVAELNENKNQQMLVDMMKEVKKDIPSARLMLVGPDHENGKLQKYAAKLGLSDSVFFLGWRNDIPELLRISDVYVASSKSEGLGLNLIEAMACDLPVIASKNRGHCECITDGSNGMLVNFNDYQAMASKVLQLSKDSKLRNKLTVQAQIDICQYESNSVLEELNDIYTKHC